MPVTNGASSGKSTRCGHKMNNIPGEITVKPIGFFESEQVEPYHAGRQPDILGLSGKIKLNPGQNFEQALTDLVGCSHIWVIFGFHKNENWKPMVQTPRSNKKIGVFATRAPYRPNPLGLSLVRLVDIRGLTIEVAENDILDGSPIYDIKPYHPEHDVVADAKIEWLENSTLRKNEISFSPLAEAQLEFLESEVSALRAFILRQLEYDALNDEKKRVRVNEHFNTLSYRTWRIDFSISENQIGVIAIHSGYSDKDLDDQLPAYNDPYEDKELHRRFRREFP